MVWRLVVDAVRRRWMMGVLAVFQLHNVARIGPTVATSVDPFAWALVFAWFMSVPALPLFQGREIYQLPLRRRTLWRARWWLATVGAVLISQIGMSLGVWTVRFEWPHGEPLALIVVYAFLYCGCDMALQSTAYGKLGEQPAVPGKLFANVKFFLPVWVMFGASPFFFAKYLPHTFAALTPPWLLLLVGAAFVTAIGYLHQPHLVARPSMRVGRSQRENASAAMRQESFGRLTGLQLLAWRTAKRAFIVYGVLLMAGVIAALALAPDFRVALRLADALPFSNAASQVSEPFTYGSLLMFGSMLDLWFCPHLRPLRALPMSTSSLALIPLIIGLVSALSLWLVLLIVHGAVLANDPVTLRPDLLVIVAGVLVATNALRFALPAPLWFRYMASVTAPMLGWLVALRPASEWQMATVRPAMFVIGLGLMLLAFAAARWSIRASTSLYEAPSVPVRL